MKKLSSTEKVGIAVLLAIAFLLSAWLLGNPMALALDYAAARAHLRTAYPGADYRITSMGYDFVAGDLYYFHVTSPSSPDSSFTLDYDGRGRLRLDDYAHRVAGRGNTANRLQREYRQLVAEALGENFDTDSRAFRSFGWGELDLDPATLELDGIYDLPALGKEGGQLYLSPRDGLDTRELADLLLMAAARVEEAGVPFRTVELHFCWREMEDWENYVFKLEGIPTEDIFPEGMTERLEGWMTAYLAAHPPGTG